MKRVFPFIIALLLVSCEKDQTNMVSLSVSVTPNSAGTIDPESGDFIEGTEIQLKAVPSDGYVFGGWSGDLESKQNPVEVTLTDDLEIVAKFMDLDEDGDGVANENDLCANTENQMEVDENGCAQNQKDSDNDGVTDDLDQCSNTPEGEDVDGNGCAANQKDSDGDGVDDASDLCADTPEDMKADENGCSANQRDSDSDGVTDDKDQCPETQADTEVDEQGCSNSQKDSDGDGVFDDVDQCPDTDEGAEADENGCTTNQLDSDGDGVTDDIDQCPDTQEGVEVDEKGCSLSAKTYIPDDELERYLIENGFDDEYDDYALTENIRKAETLHVDGSGLNAYDIEDLTGLHDFDGLKRLTMSFASFEYLEIDGLESLERLTFNYGTGIQNLTVSNNPKLTSIGCDRAGFGDFTITQNPSMESFAVGVRCGFKSLSIYDDGTKSISVDGDMNIRESLFVKNLPRLERIIIGTVNIENINASEGLPTLAEVFSSPQATIGSMTLNSPNLKKLSLWRYEGWLNIADYPLLEDLTLRFVNLETDFDVSQNLELKTIYLLGLSMEELDISNNTKLTNIRLQADLKRINITKAPLLEHFFISNPLDGLDISQNPLLKSLQGPIKMPAIDLSTVPLLETLSVDGAELVSLDVSPCPLLQVLSLSSSPNLYCIQVSEEQLANIPPTWNIESHQSYSLDCN